MWGKEALTIIRAFVNEGGIIRMVTFLFNETCPPRRSAALAMVGAVLISAAAFSGWAAASPEPAQSAPAEGSGPANLLPASENQAIAQLKGAWWMGRGLHDLLWSDFDPNSIPVLMIERRPGRAPWALLMGHAAPPAGFALVSAGGADAPAIYGAKEAGVAAGAASPLLFAGKSSAVYFAGESIPDSPYGTAAAERIIPQIIHEMAHVYALSKGMPADLVPASPPAFTPAPELVALTVLENRILAEFLYADTSKTIVMEELARQFLAVRRARWALMGKAADYERRVELFEAPAFYAQSQAMKLGAQKQIEPPPIQEADPSYHSFQFGLLWRLNVLISRLVDTPLEPAQVIARIPFAGAAQVMMLERLGVDWRDHVFKADTPLSDLLAARLTLDPSQQEGALTAARATYGYAPALALARERLSAAAGR